MVKELKQIDKEFGKYPSDFRWSNFFKTLGWFILFLFVTFAIAIHYH